MDTPADKLFKACQYGNLSEVRTIINSGECSVNVLDQMERSLLHITAMSGYDDLCRVLVKEYRLEVDQPDQINRTPLHLAALEGCVNVVCYLLETGAASNVIDKNGSTPLHLAALRGHLKVIELLYDKGINTDTSAVDNVGWTPLHRASVSVKGTATVCYLLQRNAFYDALSKRGESPLHLAAKGGCHEIARELLLYGANHSLVDKDGCSPLHYAAISGSEQTAELLINYHADLLAINNNGDTALHLAIQHGHEKVVAMLLKDGQVNVSTCNKNGWAPLHLAVESKHERVVVSLLEHGADPNCAIATDGCTPLHLATKGRNYGIVAQLINHGAATNAVDKFGKRAIDAAGQSIDVFVELLEGHARVRSAGSSNGHLTDFYRRVYTGTYSSLVWSQLGISGFNAVDTDGNTFLHVACHRKRWVAVEILLQTEMNTIEAPKLSAIYNTAGFLPIEIAIKKGCDISTLILLLEANNLSQSSSVVQRIEKYLRSTKSPSYSIEFKRLLSLLQYKVKQSNVHIHLCGAERNGKTSVRNCLTYSLKDLYIVSMARMIYNTEPLQLPAIPSTVGMEITTVENGDRRWIFFDYGGQDEYHVNHDAFLSAPESIYVVILAPLEFNLKNLSDCAGSICLTYERWLKFINSATISNKIPCITVVNHGDTSSVNCSIEKATLTKHLSTVQEKFMDSKLNFIGDPIFMDARQPHEARMKLNQHMFQCADFIVQAPKIPQMEIIILVEAKLQELRRIKKLVLSLMEFLQFILQLTESTDMSPSVYRLSDLVLAKLTSSGQVLVVGSWIIIDPNWLTRDVLGNIARNIQNNEQRRLKLSAEDVDALSATMSGITASSYFEGDVYVLPQVLCHIGACIPASIDQNSWYLVFTRYMPSSKDCQVVDIRHPNHGRLIVRRFKVRSATSNHQSPRTLPPGYFPKLFVAIANRLPKFESIEIFDGAVEVNYSCHDAGRIQVIVRKETCESFFLVISSASTSAYSSHSPSASQSQSSKKKHSTAWTYYLEIISLLYNVENVFLESVVKGVWEYQELALEEECMYLKEHLPRDTKSLFIVPYCTVVDTITLSKMESDLKSCASDSPLWNNYRMAMYGINSDFIAQFEECGSPPTSISVDPEEANQIVHMDIKLLIGIRDILANLVKTSHEDTHVLRQHSIMLQTLISNTHSVPTLAVILPVTNQGSIAGDILQNRFRLVFVCQHTLLPAICGPSGDGYEISITRDWVNKAVPLLQVGRVLLKEGLAQMANTVTAFVNSDMVDAAFTLLGFPENVMNVAETAKYKDLVNQFQTGVDVTVNDLTKYVNSSAQESRSAYEAIRSFLADQDPTLLNLGLQFVQSGERHGWIWPLPSVEESFKSTASTGAAVSAAALADVQRALSEKAQSSEPIMQGVRDRWASTVQETLLQTTTSGNNDDKVTVWKYNTEDHSQQEYYLWVDSYSSHVKWKLVADSSHVGESVSILDIISFMTVKQSQFLQRESPPVSPELSLSILSRQATAHFRFCSIGHKSKVVDAVKGIVQDKNWRVKFQ